MTVEAIKDAIAGLPEEERHSLAVWLNQLDYDDWNREIEGGFLAGRRDFLAREAREEKVRGALRGL